jgi:acetylornithine deacetylase/succinyl-diaminopimelate desuccinylase-like protein
MSEPQNVVELLQALISIPSVNPEGSGDPGTTRVGEGECAHYVADFLQKCGAEVILDEVEPDRPNVIGSFASNSSEGHNKPRVLFAPHTDTVSVAGMTIDPFGGEIREGKIWGRGASDTKGTMAAMLWAFRELGNSIADLDIELGFVGLMGEETGQPGSRHFAKNHGEEWDFAIVGEPTGLDVVCQHKGCVWLQLITRGRAAHGATPERGENAVTSMLKILQKIDIDFRTDLQDEKYLNPMLGSPTLNIGTIQGGSKTNIVPDHCEATLDFRETPELMLAGGVMKKLERYLDENGLLSLVEVHSILECSALNTDSDNAFVKQVCELGSEPVGAPWFCDAAWLAAGGIPAVALGPGSIAQAHTKDEWLEVAALEEGTAFYQKIMETLGCK